jgi:hypothetical protein
MPQWLASLIAALIGASVGSIGAVLASGALKRRAELSERREALVQRYLYQAELELTPEAADRRRSN